MVPFVFYTRMETVTYLFPKYQTKMKDDAAVF